MARIAWGTEIRRLAAVFLVCVGVAMPLVLAIPAHAAKSASLTIDANSGRVLHARNADAQRFPASLTKLMTLYLVFEAIELGQLTYDSQIRFSAHAASMQPSKLGAKVGSTISVRDAVGALIVKSANDVAVAVAEHLAGSEVNFARRMTKKARELGMRQTTFRNASGLPDAHQVTTAHDMVRLALRLQDHFPKHYENFARTSFTYNGRRYRTHNAIVRSFPGADGLKTGYIRASGFNIVSSARRGRKHVVVAVFGGKSAKARNRQTRLLLNRGLAKAATRRTRTPNRWEQPSGARVARSRASRPRERQETRVVTLPSPRPVLTRSRPPRPATPVAVARVRATPFVRSDARQGPPSGGPRTIEELIHLTAAPRLVTRPPEPSIDRSLEPASPGGDFAIQVGAYANQHDAQRQIARIRLAHGDILAGTRGATPTVSANSRVLYRARFVGFEQRRAAEACEVIRTNGTDCLVARHQD